jgi:lipopolysaccharide export system permease protein
LKKLDSLVCKSFALQFVLTFFVIVFILLMVQMLRYFDEVIGKDLGVTVVAQLMFYFAVFTTPTALPLAVLVSSLMTFGNMSESFELTAIKSAGVSPLRMLSPLIVIVIGLSIFAFYLNNRIVPGATLQAYSLIYDIRQKKPALDIKEGTFYHGLNGFSIKVDKKFAQDDRALKGIVVYDHRSENNDDVTVADSGRMYTILNERYLKFEMFNGHKYTQGGNDWIGNGPVAGGGLTRIGFSRSQMVYDLASFDFVRSSAAALSGLGVFKSMEELSATVDSLSLRQSKLRSVQLVPVTNYVLLPDAGSARHVSDSLWKSEFSQSIASAAVGRARNKKTLLALHLDERSETLRQIRIFDLQWHRIMSSSIACLAMLMVGASLGTIIRKGGVGVPFLIAIICFIVYFVATMLAEKLARHGAMSVPVAGWLAVALLFVAGSLLALVSRRDIGLIDVDAWLNTIRWLWQKPRK